MYDGRDCVLWCGMTDLIGFSALERFEEKGSLTPHERPVSDGRFRFRPWPTPSLAAPRPALR